MIRLQLLGSTELIDGRGVPLAEAMRRQKAVALLAYLAVARPRGSHRRDKLAALFWPELSGERARAALRVTLSRLREDVGGDVIRSSLDDVGIREGHLECDVLRLEEALASADASRVSDLYRGHFMDGVHVGGTADGLEDWMSFERRRLKDATVRLLISAATGSAESGAVDAAVQFARRAIEISPTEELPYRTLMELLIQSGDQGAALAAYTELERSMTRAFGIAPSADVRALAGRLRSDFPPAAAIIPPVVAAPRHQAPTAPRRFVWMVAGSVLTILALNGMSMRQGRQVQAAARWMNVTTEARGVRPAGRIEGGAALDTAGDLIVFGGQLYMTDSAPPLADLWRLRGVEEGRDPFWTRLRPRGTSPRPRWLFGIAGDTTRDRIIVHGGAFGRTSPCGADTWILDHPSTDLPEWRPLAVHGESIPPRAGFNAGFDAVAQRLVVFGGHDCTATFFNETWVLALDDTTARSGGWILLHPDTTDGAPAPRSSYASAYDGANHRLYIHGGSAGGRPLPGLWVLEHADGATGLPAWRTVACDGNPGRYQGQGAVYDSRQGAMILFGGIDSTGAHSRDLWRVSGLAGNREHCRWERLQQNDPSPGARIHPSVLLDGRTDGLILFGGAFNENGFSDAWVLRKRR